MVPGCNSGHVEANLGHATKHNTSQYDGQYNYTIATSGPEIKEQKPVITKTTNAVMT